MIACAKQRETEPLKIMPKITVPYLLKRSGKFSAYLEAVSGKF